MTLPHSKERKETDRTNLGKEWYPHDKRGSRLTNICFAFCQFSSHIPKLWVQLSSGAHYDTGR